MIIPDGWDVAVFIMYTLYDYSSAWELFPQDDLSPWAYYAFGAFGFGCAHAIYTIVLLVMTIIDMFSSEYRFEANNSSIQDEVFFWSWIAVNSVAIAIPLSKLIWVFVEEEQPENGFFRMKTE